MCETIQCGVPFPHRDVALERPRGLDGHLAERLYHGQVWFLFVLLMNGEVARKGESASESLSGLVALGEYGASGGGEEASAAASLHD